MDFRKLLEYYLTSDEWEYELLSFFECYKHRYDPHEDRYDLEHGKVYLNSVIYYEHEKRLSDGGGTYFSLYLTSSQFERFFDVRYSAEHRFAVLFGMWFGLIDAQIRILASLRNKRCCLQLLNYFLCNPEAATQPTVAELNNFSYHGKYFAEIFEGNQQADLETSFRSSHTIPVKEMLPDGNFSLENTEVYC